MELIELYRAETNAYHCPFNSTHSMPYKTIILHLTKCPDKKNSPAKSCPFNSLHYARNADELAVHVENCPDRSLLNEVLYDSPDVKRPDVNIDKQPTVMLTDEESWDAQEGESINVIRNIKSNVVCMKPSYGLTKSERKKYRTEMSRKCSNVNLSYDANISIGHRRDSAYGGKKAEQDAKEKTLFFGKRP